MFTCTESAPTWEENTQELTSKPIVISAPARNPMKEPLMRKRGFFGAVVFPFEVEDSVGFVGFDWFVGLAEFAEGISLFKGCSIGVPILNRMADISAGINLVTAEIYLDCFQSYIRIVTGRRSFLQGGTISYGMN